MICITKINQINYLLRIIFELPQLIFNFVEIISYTYEVYFFKHKIIF